MRRKNVQFISICNDPPTTGYCCFGNRKIFIAMSFSNYQQINSDWLHANKFSMHHLNECVCVCVIFSVKLVAHRIIHLNAIGILFSFFSQQSFVIITFDRSILSTNSWCDSKIADFLEICKSLSFRWSFTASLIPESVVIDADRYDFRFYCNCITFWLGWKGEQAKDQTNSAILD